MKLLVTARARYYSLESRLQVVAEAWKSVTRDDRSSGTAPPSQDRNPLVRPDHALAVLAVSLASLLTSLQSGRSMHALIDQNRRLVSAQSTPLLMTHTSNQDDHGLPVLDSTISNVGTGPARIAWFQISDPHGFDYSGGALADRVAKLSQKSFVLSRQISSQSIAAILMRSGDQRLVWSWPKPVGNQAALAEWNKLNQT